MVYFLTLGGFTSLFIPERRNFYVDIGTRGKTGVNYDHLGNPFGKKWRRQKIDFAFRFNHAVNDFSKHC